MADQGSIWLQMVIIATAAIFFALETTKTVYFTSLLQNSPDHLMIVFIWPGNITDAQVKFYFRLNLSLVLH